MRRLLLLALAVAAPAVPQTILEEQAELVRAKAEARAALARSAQLERESARATGAAAKARAAEAAVAARIQAAEADLQAARARVAVIDQLQARQRARLEARQGPIIRLTAALQTMARRPPVMALVQPGSIADAVHARALLSSTLPVIRARTADLRAELAQSEQLRRRAAQAQALLEIGQRKLGEERVALTRLEAEHRRRSSQLADSAMFESDRATALGEQARDIADLMQEMGRQSDVRERLATLAGPRLRPPVPGQATAPAGDALAKPAARPPYRLPVLGTVVTGLGEVSSSGVRARGLTLRTASGAQVVAPAAGRIAFAGPFRGYERIVIVDHGGGWTSLVTGLSRLAVAVGDTVDQGSPIGRAGYDARPAVTIELRRGNRPVDITPLVAAGSGERG